MQWLRKSILRATGLKAKHDEDAIYEATVATLRAAGDTPGRDRVAFVLAFKGVFLEGLEVVILVITLGTSAHRLGLGRDRRGDRRRARRAVWRDRGEAALEGSRERC